MESRQNKSVARRLRRSRKEAKTPTAMPREIVERVERVRAFHASTKHTYASVRLNRHKVDWATQPSPFRVFEDCLKVDLPADVLPADAPALAVLSEGVAGLPSDAPRAVQDLRTLSTWLTLANGITRERRVGEQTVHLRTCPSSSALFPFDVYVAAFAVEGLEPGLYHYSVKERALRKLRDGHTALAQIKKGRPDLDFLKTVPAALLVSTIFSRSTWRYRLRGYRYALIDAGHLVQNLVTAANGLGIQTTTRLSMNDRTTRELIGMEPHVSFDGAEAVQAMVVWAESALNPMPARIDGAATSAGGELLQPIPRQPLAETCTAFDEVVAVQEACVAPGVAVRDIRPPLTERSPLKKGQAHEDLPPPQPAGDGPPLRDVMSSRRSARDFLRDPISLEQLWTVNRLAFRGGSFYPIFPSGPHVGLVRPMWLINGAEGMEPGVWYYDPIDDRWTSHRTGEFRLEAQYLGLEQTICGNASAACFMLADIKALTDRAGPDAYRLAHLEAGVTAQRVFLAAGALGVGCAGIGPFYDDETLAFLEPEHAGWEVIYSVVLGVAKKPGATDGTAGATAAQPPQP